MIECTCKAADMPFGRCCKSIQLDSTWRGAAQWLRNNYQDHPNIASLCDAMSAASPSHAPVAQPLTLLQLHEIWAGGTDGQDLFLDTLLISFARAIERAHKIGGPQ